MALSIHEAASIFSVRRTYQYSSTVPYVHEDEAPAGCHWEFDYEWEQESAEDAPMVLVTQVRLVAHDGTEYPIKIGSLDGRWLASMEAAISDEVAAENEAASLALRDGE